MSSLRRRLTLSLWLALIVVGLLSAAASYFVTLRETNALLDYQMQEIAGFVSAQSFTDPGPDSALQPVTPAASRHHHNHDLHDNADGDGDGDDNDFLITVRNVDGRLLYASDAEAALPLMDWSGLRTMTVQGESYRVFSGRTGAMRVLIAQETDGREDTAAAAAVFALLPIALILPVLGLIINLVIKHQLQPLRDVASGISQRPALAFDALPLANLPTEVRPLVEEINRLLARLETAMKHEQRFIADAAHSLRTPLAALRLQAEVLNGSRDAEENALRLRELRAGIHRAIRLSDHLLALARNESSSGPVRGAIELDAALAENVELYQVTAESRGVRLSLRAASRARVPGDARYLALLAGNLIDNALRYTPAEGQVQVLSRIEGQVAVIEVIDEGAGLPENELEAVFERFHRAPDDPTEGSGLGLAVVRGIVNGLGGKVRLANRVDRSGLIVRVELPLIAVVPAPPSGALS